MTSRVQFLVNGTPHSVGSEVSAATSLLVYLRNTLELRGTKYMCLEGGCGTCMVAVSKHRGAPIQAVNSCLVSIASCQGWEITTIEKIGNRLTGYHPLQKTLAESNGSQCGYCSPGFVTAMYSLLQNKSLTMLDIEKSLGSNVCRCTGYRPILDAFKKFAIDAPTSDLLDIEDLRICKKSGEVCNKETCEEAEWCFVTEDHVKPSIFHIVLSDGRHWYVVQEVSDIFEIFQDKATAKNSYMLVAGNTAKGVVPIDSYPQLLIDISRVNQLKGYKIDQNLVLGAGNTLTETIDIFNNVGNQEYFGYLKILNKHLDSVAHIPVRNLGTVAGNLMIKYYNNNFKSDIYLLLNTIGAEITIMSGPKNTKILSMEEFLLEDMKEKIIINIKFPPLSREYKLVTYKIMPRAQNAQAIVNAGFLYKVNVNNMVQECRIAYGGLSSAFNRARKTEKYLIGKKLFTNEVLQGAIEVLYNELVVTDNPPDTSVEYRHQLAIGLFYKGLLSLCPPNILKPRYSSGATNLKFDRGVSKGQQEYETEPSLYPLNEPIQKVDALVQCAGEAMYTDDSTSLPNEVFGAFVLSSVSLGTIDKIDPSDALKQPGVIAFYSAKDIPGLNSFTPADNIYFSGNEEVLCSGEVKYYNQPLGIIAAESEYIANAAAKLVKVTYSNIKSPVIDVKIAKTDATRTTLFSTVNATNPGTEVDKKIKGSSTLYGQYHFCTETLVCVSQSTEEGLSLNPASQWMDAIHLMTSRFLNMNQSRIDVKIRRVGGGFGLKVSRSNQIAMACSLISYKLNRPCRFIQSLQTNMRAVGKRLPCTTDYEIAFNNDGVIQYINEDLYEDNGYIFNETLIILAQDTYCNCYDKSKWNFKSYNALTDTASNTWCRAPGTLESIAMAETVMERIVYDLSLDPFDVRLANVDPEKINDINEMVNTIKQKSSYILRKAKVEKFNKENRWKKQGLGVTFMNWKAAASSLYMNVNISVYHGDGTVSIAHGGVEIGQAINTKAAQICAYFLKIPVEKIQIKAMDTTINPNCFVTGASITTQSIGLGVQRACEELLKRLEPIRVQMGNPTWEELIVQAYNAGIDLQAHGQTITGLDNNYDIYGVTVAQVTVDIITGEWEIDRVDILEDVGQSVNPNMDVGQVEGAFVMGAGYWTSENLIYNKKTGEILTDRTWNYWVPQARDIPQDFRIYFREKSYGVKLFLGAKTTGEPATCMAIAVPFAIRQAFTSARQECGIPSTQWHQIDGPYTVEKICLATSTNVKDFKFY